MYSKLIALIGLTSCLAVAAEAEEQMRTLAVSGSWMAAAHSENMISRPDVCMVFNPVAKVLFRSDGDTVELRVLNDDWSLPANVRGDIQVGVGPVNKTMEITSNTDKWVAAEIPENEVVPLFAAMDKAATMTIVPGKAKPIAVSLSGSTKATNAFRTCAGIQSNAQTPGANPFQ